MSDDEASEVFSNKEISIRAQEGLERYDTLLSEVRQRIPKEMHELFDSFASKWLETDFPMFKKHFECFLPTDLLEHLKAYDFSKIRRNRRFQYLLTNRESDYFKLESMRERQPQLYEYYIGQYEPPRQMSSSTKLSDILFDLSYSGSHIEQLDDFSDGFTHEKNMIAEKEKLLLMEEFVSLMYERFLEGEQDFDYSKIDHNEDLIDNEELHEKYFEDFNDLNFREYQQTKYSRYEKIDENVHTDYDY